VLTRELIYTAITRARLRFTLARSEAKAAELQDLLEQKSAPSQY